MKSPAFAILLFALAAVPARAGESLYDAALDTLGATAQGTASKFNRDWPAGRALLVKRGGTIFNPFEGATINVRLIMPVEIRAVEITGLDYASSRQVSGVDIFIDGKKVSHADLPDQPGKPTRVEVPPTIGQFVRLVATGGHPTRTGKDGKPGPDWGGFAKISVLTPVNLADKLAPVEGYSVSPSPSFISPTALSHEGDAVMVEGQPRMAEGHPRTMWDKEDIARFRALLKTSPALASQYDILKKAMDEALDKPIALPEPVKDASGNWTHLPESAVSRAHNNLALLISNLGTIYALSGEEKYADYAKKLLLAYADVFDKYAPGNRPGFTHDQGRLFDQRLSDATWLIPVVRGYDLVRSSPSFTPEERKHVEEDFLKASARFIAANNSVLRAPTNWSAICTTAVLITGYATDDQDLIDLAMYGPKGTKEKPTGGVILHFSDKCISPDGLWSEGAIGYQFMAMQSLIANAEILWRNGIDMYRYRNGALKKLFDSPLAYSYPDLKTPAVHDSGSVDIVGRESYLYEFGYQRYRDPKYLVILNHPNVATRLDVRFQQFPISVLYDRDLKEAAAPVEWMSENFGDVGFGVLRNTTDAGTASLLLDYGPNRSHGHPDKLNIDLWTSRTGRLLPDPGIVWYEKPLYRNWYRTSVAHNTLVVDERDQRDSDGRLLVYGSADTMGLQRAQALDAAPGVIMDRGVFLTPEYLADIFGAFARLPRTFDLAWHVVGEFSSGDLSLQPFQFPEPRPPGYSELSDVQSAHPKKPWQATFTVRGVPVRFHAAVGNDAEVILGDGWLGRERPKTILLRRQTNEAVYGNVVDFSGQASGFVRGATLEGSLEKGYALLSIDTARGQDMAFVSYRPGAYRAGGIETDAQQAFVRMEGTNPSGLFLGGGTTLRAHGVGLSLTAPGLVSLEKETTGAWVLANLSPQKSEAQLDFPALSGRKVYMIDAKAQRSTSVPYNQRVVLEPGQRLEFTEDGMPSLHDARTTMLSEREKQRTAALAAERDAAKQRSLERAAASAAHPVPAGVVLVKQAEDFTAQGEGSVAVANDKVGQVGKSLSSWNEEGQWLEWSVEAPEEGYYQLSLCYCTEPNNSTREIRINGEVQEPYSPILLAATGGYSNGNDDWQLHTAKDAISGDALLVKLKKGSNVIRLTNVNGLAANLDYLMISSPDVSPARLKPNAQ